VKAKMVILVVSAIGAAGLFAAGCGSSSSGASSQTETGATSTTETGATSTEAPATQEAAGVPSEELSAATGDIPDSQNFLLFNDPQAGYSIRYPEGWARKGAAGDVTFQEKANVIHITVGKGPMPSEATAVAGVAKLHQADSTVKAQAPEKITLGGQPAVKITYSRQSGADPVTGKRLPLIVDRYELGHKGKVAILDLGTPVGVDNVDAYRLISESFKWHG
jgi:hypothetical protein